MQFSFTSIGTLATPFKEKFGVPRQSLMMTEALGLLKLCPAYSQRAALEQLACFSHLWLVFVFHKNLGDAWHPLIDTPRVDAKGKIGVFATRSPHRPNPIGLSAVKLERIDFDAPGGIELHLSGVDILDGTPVLDIKPYLPYADRIADANSGWVHDAIERFPVTFSAESLATIQKASARYPRLQALIEQMLAGDPRPTSQRRAAPLSSPQSNGLRFAFRVLDLDIRWEPVSGVLHVVEIVDLASA